MREAADGLREAGIREGWQGSAGMKLGNHLSRGYQRLRPARQWGSQGVGAGSLKQLPITQDGEEAQGNEKKGSGTHSDSPTAPLCPSSPASNGEGLEGLMPIEFPEQSNQGPIFPRFQKAAYNAGLCFI